MRGRQHIGCGHSRNFALGCPSDRQMVTVGRYEIEQILYLHNMMRNKIASGSEKGFKGATHMPLMVIFYSIKSSQFLVKKIFNYLKKKQKWDEELANLAALNVMQCKMAHDQCRNTAKFKYAGQNLGFRGNSREFEGTSSFIQNILWAWYNEIKDANSSDIAKCCGKISKIGHFLQIIQDNAEYVGCAIAKYTNNGRMKSLLLACNYSYTNMMAQPVYKSGSSASNCGSKGRNSKYTSLCN